MQNCIIQTPRRLLANVMDIGPFIKDIRVFICRLELLRRMIEMIFDRPLVLSGDDENIINTGPDRFLNYILDDRLIDYRQHLFRLGFSDREKPCTVPCRRDYHSSFFCSFIPSPADSPGILYRKNPPSFKDNPLFHDIEFFVKGNKFRAVGKD